MSACRVELCCHVVWLFFRQPVDPPHPPSLALRRSPAWAPWTGLPPDPHQQCQQLPCWGSICSGVEAAAGRQPPASAFFFLLFFSRGTANRRHERWRGEGRMRPWRGRRIWVYFEGWKEGHIQKAFGTIRTLSTKRNNEFKCINKSDILHDYLQTFVLTTMPQWLHEIHYI